MTDIIYTYFIHNEALRFKYTNLVTQCR